MNDSEICPHCNKDLTGEVIPKEDRPLFGDHTHFSRKIGIDGGRINVYDGVIAWMCPHCKGTWSRGDSEWAQEMYNKYLEVIKCSSM